MFGCVEGVDGPFAAFCDDYNSIGHNIFVENGFIILAIKRNADIMTYILI